MYQKLHGGSYFLNTNLGGRRGLSGTYGIDGQRAPPGQDGQDGTFHIEVLDGGAHLNYDRIFNLNLLKFELAPDKEDGIIEPGCRVLVSSIKIKNVGGMPTPTTRGVLAYIKPNDCGPAILNRPSWVVSEGYDRFVQLPPGLEPNATTDVVCAKFNRRSNGSIVPKINAEGEYLAFCIAPVDPVLALSTLPDRQRRGEPFSVTASLTIRAQMTPFGRDFDSFVNPMPFTVTYPVKMGPVTSLPAIPPGGNTFVRFSISNVALREYGQDSEIGRVVIVKATYTRGNLGASQMQFVPTVDGNPTSPIAFNQPTFDERQVFWSIPRLSAGETRKLSGCLSLSLDAEPYSTADFSVDLLLGEIRNPTNAIRIQHRQFSICASPLYQKTPNSGTLLVVNQQTTKEEVKAWEELAGFIFGENNPAGVVDVWDISQVGDFDLNSVLKSGLTLIEEWESCTIVILDNPFKNFGTSGQNDSALQYIDPDQLAAAVSNDTHFCIVSPLLETSNAQSQHLVAPQRGIDFTSSMAFETVLHLFDPFSIEPTSFVVYERSEDFEAAEVNVLVDNTVMPTGFWSKEPQPPIHETHPNSPHAYTRMEQIILVQRNKPFKSLNKVVKIAEKLQKELLRKHPERRYTFSACHSQEIEPVLQQLAGCQIPPKMQAAIRVRRLLDVFSLSSRITLTAAPASPVDKSRLSPNATTIHTPEFIKSPQVISAFVQSIPYARRITLYVEALGVLDLGLSINEPEERASVLRASLLADLACEQEALRLKKRSHGLTEACFKLLLPRLSAFCQIDLTAVSLEFAGRGHLLDLLADLKAYIASKSSWYQRIFPGYRSSQVTKVSNDLINDFISRISSSGVSAKKHVAAASSKTLKEWKKDLKSTKKSLSASGNPNELVTLEGRAFAALLGSVACMENKWSDNPNNHTSIAGSVCTEFGILSSPESFGAGSITCHEDAMAVTNKSITRKSTIKSRSTINKRVTSDFTSNASDGENGVTLSHYQLGDGLDVIPDEETTGGPDLNPVETTNDGRE